ACLLLLRLGLIGGVEHGDDCGTTVGPEIKERAKVGLVSSVSHQRVMSPLENEERESNGTGYVVLGAGGYHHSPHLLERRAPQNCLVAVRRGGVSRAGTGENAQIDRQASEGRVPAAVGNGDPRIEV